MSREVFGVTRNSVARPLESFPVSEFDTFREEICERVRDGARLVAFFVEGFAGGSEIPLAAVLAEDSEGRLLLGRSSVRGSSFHSLTPDCPQAHWFEREIAEQAGITPAGHPWLKPIRFHAPYRPGTEATHETPIIGMTRFYGIQGEEIHEVAVGPVHAGVIEPGHFRFQAHGEHVFNLEISLGYQHRGIERALAGGPHKLSIFQAETIAGDTTIGHTLAYCQALEALSAVSTPARGHALRGIALELERIANHVGDLGALSGDVGYLPTAAYCGRIRGDFLNMTAVLCGNRFGRGFVRPRGVGGDVSAEEIEDLLGRLRRAEKDVTTAVDLLWSTPSVVARFENTGEVSRDMCRAIGLVGVAARACGVERDVRKDHAHGIYQYAHVPVMTAHHGDVMSRAFVRWLEIQQSLEFVREQLESLPQTPERVQASAPIAPGAITVSLVEGWRGEICHVAITDRHGRFARYKIVDPSFHNWYGLALALRDQQISDFPLCNKSFNLSYCGHDL